MLPEQSSHQASGSTPSHPTVDLPPPAPSPFNATPSPSPSLPPPTAPSSSHPTGAYHDPAESPAPPPSHHAPSPTSQQQQQPHHLHPPPPPPFDFPDQQRMFAYMQAMQAYMGYPNGNTTPTLPPIHTLLPQHPYPPHPHSQHPYAVNPHPQHPYAVNPLPQHPYAAPSHSPNPYPTLPHPQHLLHPQLQQPQHPQHPTLPPPHSYNHQHPTPPVPNISPSIQFPAHATSSFIPPPSETSSSSSYSGQTEYPDPRQHWPRPSTSSTTGLYGVQAQQLSPRNGSRDTFSITGNRFGPSISVPSTSASPSSSSSRQQLEQHHNHDPRASTSNSSSSSSSLPPQPQPDYNEHLRARAATAADPANDPLYQEFLRSRGLESMSPSVSSPNIGSEDPDRLMRAAQAASAFANQEGVLGKVPLQGNRNQYGTKHPSSGSRGGPGANHVWGATQGNQPGRGGVPKPPKPPGKTQRIKFGDKCVGPIFIPCRSFLGSDWSKGQGLKWNSATLTVFAGLCQRYHLEQPVVAGKDWSPHQVATAVVEAFETRPMGGKLNVGAKYFDWVSVNQATHEFSVYGNWDAFDGVTLHAKYTRGKCWIVTKSSVEDEAFRRDFEKMYLDYTGKEAGNGGAGAGAGKGKGGKGMGKGKGKAALELDEEDSPDSDSEGVVAPEPRRCYNCNTVLMAGREDAHEATCTPKSKKMAPRGVPAQGSQLGSKTSGNQRSAGAPAGSGGGNRLSAAGVDAQKRVRSQSVNASGSRREMLPPPLPPARMPKAVVIGDQVAGNAVASTSSSGSSTVSPSERVPIVFVGAAKLFLGFEATMARVGCGTRRRPHGVKPEWLIYPWDEGAVYDPVRNYDTEMSEWGDQDRLWWTRIKLDIGPWRYTREELTETLFQPTVYRETPYCVNDFKEYARRLGLRKYPSRHWGLHYPIPQTYFDLYIAKTVFEREGHLAQLCDHPERSDEESEAIRAQHHFLYSLGIFPADASPACLEEIEDRERQRVEQPGYVPVGLGDLDDRWELRGHVLPLRMEAKRRDHLGSFGLQIDPEYIYRDISSDDEDNDWLKKMPQESARHWRRRVIAETRSRRERAERGRERRLARGMFDEDDENEDEEANGKRDSDDDGDGRGVRDESIEDDDGQGEGEETVTGDSDQTQPSDNPLIGPETEDSDDDDDDDDSGDSSKGGGEGGEGLRFADGGDAGTRGVNSGAGGGVDNDSRRVDKGKGRALPVAGSSKRAREGLRDQHEAGLRGKKAELLDSGADQSEDEPPSPRKRTTLRRSERIRSAPPGDSDPREGRSESLADMDLDPIPEEEGSQETVKGKQGVPSTSSEAPARHRRTASGIQAVTPRKLKLIGASQSGRPMYRRSSDTPTPLTL